MSSHYKIYVIYSKKVSLFFSLLLFPDHIDAFFQSRREPKYTLMIHILFSHLKSLPEEPFSLFSYRGKSEL